jgi:hypothetical protein
MIDLRLTHSDAAIGGIPGSNGDRSSLQLVALR